MKKWIQTGLAAIMLCTAAACTTKTEDDHLSRINAEGKRVIGLE